MFYTEYIFITVLLVFSGYQRSNGGQISLCYLRINDSNSSLCETPMSVEECCPGKDLNVDRIEVFHESGCDSPSMCITGGDCCTSNNTTNISAHYITGLEDAFKRTKCFGNIPHITHLPINNGLDRIVVTYSCGNKTRPHVPTTSTTEITIPTSAYGRHEPTASTTETTVTTTPSRPTNISQTTNSEHNTKFVVAVAVPIILIVVIAVVVVVILCMRRRGANKLKHSHEVLAENSTSNSEPQPKYDPRCIGAPPSNDDTTDKEYAEIPDSHTNSFLEIGEYNTIDLILHPMTQKSYFSNRKSIENEDYDHIGMQPAIKAKTYETYSHNQHIAPRNLNKCNCSNGTDTYAHIAHGPKPRHDVNFRNVDEETYDTTSSVKPFRMQCDDVGGMGSNYITEQTKDSSDGDDYGYPNVPVGNETIADNNSDSRGNCRENTGAMNDTNEYTCAEHT